MIIDFVEKLDRYRGLSPNIELAIECIKTAKLSESPLGNTAVAGSRVRFNHLRYTTAPRGQDSLFEAHREYIDLHIILSGREFMDVAPVRSLEWVEKMPDKDTVMYRGKSMLRIPVEVGRFVMLYPGEGHMPRLAADGIDSEVDKIVFKIKI